MRQSGETHAEVITQSKEHRGRITFQMGGVKYDLFVLSVPFMKLFTHVDCGRGATRPTPDWNPSFYDTHIYQKSKIMLKS